MEWHPKGRLRIDERQAKTLHMMLKADREPRTLTKEQENDLKALLQELQRTMEDFGWAP